MTKGLELMTRKKQKKMTMRCPKKLKKELSLDTEGYPRCFGTPDAEKGSGSKDALTKGCALENDTLLTKEGLANDILLTKEGHPPSFLRRRTGQFALANRARSDLPIHANNEELKEELGIMKRPARKKGAKKTMKKPSSLTKGSGKVKKDKQDLVTTSSASAGGKPWTKLRVTTPKKPPWRVYICGTKAKGGTGKLSLIVQTTQVGHPRYVEIMGEIKQKLEQEHLSKQEAIDLRDHWYKTW